MKNLYLDNNATTLISRCVEKALINKIRLYRHGNLNSDNANIRDLRNEITELIFDTGFLFFTSSGSEANTTVINSALRKSSRKKFVTSEIEHESIQKQTQYLKKNGYKVSFIKVLKDGVVDVEHARTLIDQDTALVSVQMVNNETGVIQPIEELQRIAHEKGCLFHTDAAQAIGKMRLDYKKIPLDYITFTAHKIHGPKGVGAVWCKHNPQQAIHPLIFGGGQEYGIRGGTHNVLGIIGFSTAVKERFKDIDTKICKIRNLRDAFEEEVNSRIDGVYVNGGAANRVCNTSNLFFDGIPGQALYLQLINKGIICSQTSACTAMYPEPSKVLRAMGLSYDEAYSSIRFSFSEMNTMSEVKKAVRIIEKTVKRLRSITGGVS